MLLLELMGFQLALGVGMHLRGIDSLAVLVLVLVRGGINDSQTISMTYFNYPIKG